MIVLFAERNLKALAGAWAGSPAQFGWLLTWQAQKFGEALPPGQKSHFEDFMGPLVADNFIKQPSSGPAFMQMAADFYEELRRNSTRFPLGGAGPCCQSYLGRERSLSHRRARQRTSVPLQEQFLSSDPSGPLASMRSA